VPTSIYTNEDIYKPELWAMESLEIFHDIVGIRNSVHTDFKDEVANKGDTVNTRIPAVFTAEEANATGGVDTVQSPQATNVQVVLDQNFHVTFDLRDVTQAKSLKNLREEYFEPAVIALVEQIENDGITALSHATTGFGNTTLSNVIETVATGTTPDVLRLEHIAKAARLLDENRIPNRMRTMVISPKQMEDLITSGGTVSSSLLMKSNEIGGESALRERRIGRLQGFDIAMQQGIATTADVTGTGYPDADSQRALYWYRNGVSYVTRPLPTPPTGSGASVAVRSFENQAMRVAVGYEILNKRLLISLDAIWGWKPTRLEAGGSIVTAA